ncbi:unnamed protein product [Cuscuta europaea]|uniref:Thaumatin-like protein n=1 Tax=Cuscuta europaea TaxID=41803 RepID=A0A9P1EAG4_CUSEU|nr:unnamed protein product [Cuscuta europaea]
MGLSKPYQTYVLFVTLIITHFISYACVESCTFFVTNKCPFNIWPATAPNVGHPVVANGGFYLPSGKTRSFQVPEDWSGRVWARTGCDFDSYHRTSCETGDCDGKLECCGSIGLPPATLVEITLQVDQGRPSSYDVSLVDGYNLPVSVSTTRSSPECYIGGCSKNLNDASVCPPELRVLNNAGKVVACKSACLAFNADPFCCRNEYGSPDKCKPTLYSKIFKNACPSYVSYAYDRPSPAVNCWSDKYWFTFCPDKHGSGGSST